MLRSIKTILFLALALFHTQAYAQIFKVKDKAEELYNEAVAEAGKKNYAKAAALGNQASEARPKDADFALFTARMYQQSGNLREAGNFIHKTLKISPTYRDAYSMAINIELSKKQYYEALCFAEDGLNYFPTDRDLILKKTSILRLMDRMNAAGNYIEEIVNQLPQDSLLKRAYIDHFMEAGLYYRKKEIPALASQSYQRILTMYPGNEEAKQALLALNMSTGGYYYALDQITAELYNQPRSYELLMKKAGILEEMHNYAEAIYTVNTVLKYYPSDAKARRMLSELKMEAGGYYANTDPYMIYESEYEKNPGNTVALNKLIGISMSRGAYREALNWINKGLLRRPADTKLLGQKLDVLEYDRKFTAAAEIAEILWQQQPTATNKQRFIQLKIASGREFLVQQQYDMAMMEFESILAVDPANQQALDNVVSRYVLQKKYPSALAVLDKAMAYYPEDESLVLKKAAILAESGKYENAAVLMKYLLGKQPKSLLYRNSLVEYRLAAGRQWMQTEDFDLAHIQFSEALQADTANAEALSYLVNLEASAKRYDRALAFLTRWSRHNDHDQEGDRNYILKRASILYDMGRYQEAADLSRLLLNGYPYTGKLRDLHVESLMALGREFQRNEQPDSAMVQFKKILREVPSDSLTLLYAANIMAAKGHPDSALLYIQKGIQYHPESETFWRKKVEMLESQQLFTRASLAADTLLRRFPGTANRDYADLLKSKTMRNQFGLYYLNSTYDYTENKYNIATLEYRRFFDKGSFAGRINYAGRQQGTGIQGEAELYYTHSKRFYSYAFGAASNKIAFPVLRAGYSLYTTLPKEWELELGARYLDADSSTSISGVASIGKTFDDFWVNARGYLISEESEMYSSYNLTTRYYMNNRQDYLSVIAGLGTSPDDRSRLINFPKLSGLLTRSVAAGYQKTFRYRNTFGIYGTWINQKVSDTDFQNQYDLYFLFQRKF